MDYTSGGYFVTFAPNSASGTELCATIPITDDTSVEFLESLQISASSADDQVTFSPGGGMSSINIMDNDSECDYHMLVSVYCIMPEYTAQFSAIYIIIYMHK